MRRLILALVLVTGCSCGGLVPVGSVSPAPPAFSPAAHTASPSQGPVPATPSASPVTDISTVLAVVSGPGQALRLVASDGSVIASATVDPPLFRPHALMSWTSASLSRLYYLNGGSEVRYLEPNGNSGSATRISLGAREQAGFAVSPDDKRIAVSILSYTPASVNSTGPASPTYNGMRLYVEDLQGGGHHIDIFSSTTAVEFPIGWTDGHLVVAVSSTPECCQALPLNPYAASSYHVVNPDNGDRLVSLCDASYGPSGPVEPVGVMCIEHQDGPSFKHWDGSPFPPPSAVQLSFQYLNALSPDGKRAAVGGADSMRVMDVYDDRLPVSGYLFGWLDLNHLVFQKEGAAVLSMFDLPTRTSTDLPGASYLGTFPAAIS